VPDSNCFFTINEDSVLFQLQNQSSAVYALNESRPQCSMNIVRRVKYAIQQLIVRIHTLGLRTSYQAGDRKTSNLLRTADKARSQNRDVADKASPFAFFVRLCVPCSDSNPGLVTEFAEKTLLDNADAFDLTFCGESFVEAFISKLILDVRPWCQELFE